MKKLLVFLLALGTWGWNLLKATAVLSVNLILILTLVLALALLWRPAPEVPPGAALVLAPRGMIVEKKSSIDPLTRLMDEMTGSRLPEETALQSILDAIHHAAADQRITTLVLEPDSLEGAGFNQLRDIGLAIDRFRKTGKVVIAFANAYDQGQYYLAAHADEIYLDPMGEVSLEGFGVFRLYFRQLLDKLSITVHVFRVGTFKSALEPFLRQDMSPAAKAANRDWLDKLWGVYRADISRLRGISGHLLDSMINRLDRYLERNGGDTAQMALRAGLVDGLKTRADMDRYLISIVGASDNDDRFSRISMDDYLRTFPSTYAPDRYRDQDVVGIIAAEGDIVPGEGGIGLIGADQLRELIRQARDDDHVRALVLRINSGGGSAFASEQIRRELALVREAGKPVVVSMGAVAASGAYWLAADADAILASPVTLTGSIGIFGALPTFDQSLARIGVRADGVGTTALAGAGSPTRPLSPVLSRALQLSVENGYHRFIDIVARGRDMRKQAVEGVAQGRVWDGRTARSLGLVDELGSLSDAVARAARLAGLDHVRARYLKTPSGLFSLAGFPLDVHAPLTGRRLPDSLARTLALIPRELTAPLSLLLNHADPGHVYAYTPLPLVLPHGPGPIR